MKINKLIKGLLLLSVAFALHACSKENLKDDSATRTTISAAINDTLKVFELNTLTSTANNSTVVQGYAADGSKLSITFTSALEAGKTYGTGADKPIVIYTVPVNDTTFSNTNNNVITLNVTEANDAYAKGTFSGSLIQDVVGNAKTKTVTKGTFNIKLK